MATQRYPQYRVRQPQKQRNSFGESLFNIIATIVLLIILGYILADRGVVVLPPWMTGALQQPQAPAATSRAIGRQTGGGSASTAHDSSNPIATSAAVDSPGAQTGQDITQSNSQANTAPLPTANIAVHPGSLVATVVPDTSKPLRIATPDVPQATPWVPSAEQTAAYNAVRDTSPKTYGTDATCNSSNATYVTEPITVKDKNGMPIGAVQGWSCESQAAAVAEAQQRAIEMQAGH